jgi:hypothetical protein
MNIGKLAGLGIAVAVVVATAVGGCTNVGDCPDKASIVPGASCSGDNLTCAYDLSEQSPACDGTMQTVTTSCTCQKDVWVCPSPSSTCEVPEGGAGDDGSVAEGGGDDGSTTEGGGDDGSASDDGATGDDGAATDGASADGSAPRDGGGTVDAPASTDGATE